jgi:multidrug efflux pump subunit AcrA (membrane-fusion protein)
MAGSSTMKPEGRRHRVAMTVGILLLLVVLVPVLTLGLRRRVQSQPDGSPSPSSTPVAGVVQIQRGAIKRMLILDGDLRAVRFRTVYATAQDEAKIVFLPPEGTVVKAGQRVVELDSTTLLTRIKDNEERVIAADSEIVRTAALHESALRDMYVELSKLELAFEQAKLKAKIPAEVQARREYQDAQLTLEKTRTEYENQLNKIEQKKKEQAAELEVKRIDREKISVQVERARSGLQGMRLDAPSDGMVIYSDHWNERRKIQIGDMVWGGFPIVTLPDLTEMEVIAPVNEVDGPKLSIGHKAEIRLDSYPDTMITGEVKDISQTALKASRNAQARVFKVTVGLDKTVQEIMKPGMSAQVSIVVSESQPHLLLPRSAVKFDGDTARVWRMESQEQEREITVTILGGDALYYLAADNGALKEGDRIRTRVN